MDVTDTDFEEWVGRTERRTEIVAPGPVWGLYDTLGYAHEPKAGEALPPGAHWCLFHAHVPIQEVGPDGHASRGGLMPEPRGLPRRMFAGARLEFVGDLRVGDEVTRIQEIAAVSPRDGRTGKLLFVTVRDTFEGPNGAALVQHTDIVFREPAKSANAAPAPQAPPAKPIWQRKVRPDPVMLFKYAAVTFNGHRIHYDRPYVTGEEGYPGLVVQGTLTATLLMDLCRRERANDRLTAFSFRAMAPLFDGAVFTVNGAPQEDGENWHLWAANEEGHLCMQGEASFES